MKYETNIIQSEIAELCIVKLRYILIVIGETKNAEPIENLLLNQFGITNKKPSETL